MAAQNKQKKKNYYPCNVPASMHSSPVAPPNIHVCHTRRLPQSKSFHVLLTLTTHSMCSKEHHKPVFFTSHIATSLEVLHAWSFIYVENGGEWEGWEMYDEAGDEGDEGNGFERHWKVGMKMGSGCEWCMS